jgi:prepilin-type N-terminal cleavage/methylation domain-containing protein
MIQSRSRSELLPSPPAARRGERAAFSLIELLIIIAILGILLAAASPYLSSNVATQLQMAADAVAGDLEYARGLAVANNSSYRVTLSPSTNSYILEHSGAAAALDKLFPSPFHKISANGEQLTADLAELPLVAGAVKLAAALKNPTAPSDVTDVEFGPLGGTTRSEVTQVWLSSSGTGTTMFIPITVHPTTGLVDVGDVQSVRPAGISAAATDP